MAVPASTARPVDESLAQLEAELARIEVLLRRAVYYWQAAGQDPGEPFRGLHISDALAGALVERPFASDWRHAVAAAPAVERAFAEMVAAAGREADARAAASLRAGVFPRLHHLAAAFGLDRFDLDTLLICLAPTLDLRFERLYAYLQDNVNSKRPTVNLALDLLCEDSGARRLAQLRHFAPEAPLFRYHLLERTTEPGADPAVLLRQGLAVDPTVAAWLVGGYEAHGELAGHAALAWPDASAADAVIAGAGGCDELLGGPARFAADPARAPVIVLQGPDALSLDAAGRVVAAHAGRSLLRVDLAGLIAAGVAPVHAVRLALRDARLTGSVVHLAGWDTCLLGRQEGAGATENFVREGGQGLHAAPELVAELCRHPDLVIVAGELAWQTGGAARSTEDGAGDRRFFRVRLPAPGAEQRRALWELFLGADAAQGVDLGVLTSQFALTAGQMRGAVAEARDLAARRGGTLELADLLAAARGCSNPRLGSLAHQIAPRYGWADIVLPDDQITLLQEIVATVRGRAQVLEAWQLGRKLVANAGIAMLFAGPPGTGKTMAAEVIAGELGLDLYRIDLSTIVSKYIGETEKNLEQIFREAENSNAILFFDEADAIFGKRSEVRDAHDRYANIEVSYLLQRMEAYGGLTILATNLRANLDEAFTRRLHFVVTFPFPTEEYRSRIWRTLFPPKLPAAGDLDFELLARRFKLSGSNIRNVIVSAAYLAAADGQCVGMAHLLHGVRRELQKMGRLVNEPDLVVS